MEGVSFRLNRKLQLQKFLSVVCCHCIGSTSNLFSPVPMRKLRPHFLFLHSEALHVFLIQKLLCCCQESFPFFPSPPSQMASSRPKSNNGSEEERESEIEREQRGREKASETGIYAHTDTCVAFKY